MRIVPIRKAKVPPNHNIEIHCDDKVQVIPVTDVVCDLCNELLTGKPAVAKTVWRSDGPLEDWEHEFDDEKGTQP